MAFATDGKIGIDFTANTESALFEVGSTAKATDGQEYIYVQDSGSGITQYQWVGIDEDYDATALTTAHVTAGYKVGVAQVAITADYYGWVAVLGQNLTGKFAGAVTADADLYTTATGGSLDDADSTGLQRLQGVVPVATLTAASNAEVNIVSYIHSDHIV